MIGLAYLAVAAADPGSAHLGLGQRVSADGHGGAVGVGLQAALGPDGGVLSPSVGAALGGERVGIAVQAAFARYRTALGPNSSGFGNVALRAHWRHARGAHVTLVGAEGTLPTGQAYTWAHDVTTLWPGGGGGAFVQHRHALGAADVLLRAGVGVHTTRGVRPLPPVFLDAHAALAVDVAPQERVGLLVEIAGRYWAPSPVDAAMWFRVEPLTGLRLRVGALVPVGAWAGLSRLDVPDGVREAGVLADVSTAFR